MESEKRCTLPQWSRGQTNVLVYTVFKRKSSCRSSNILLIFLRTSVRTENLDIRLGDLEVLEDLVNSVKKDELGKYCGHKKLLLPRTFNTADGESVSWPRPFRCLRVG